MADHSSSSNEAGSSSAPVLPPPQVAGKARYRHIPRTTFNAVEYPSTVSHPSALLKVITQDNLDTCFNLPAGATDTMLEMSYRMDDPSGIPVRGMRVPSSKLLLRVKRRRKRVATSDEEDGQDIEGSGSRKGKGKEKEEQGVFVAEVVGLVTQTVRFRHMADYHYTPNPEGRISSMVSALKELDYNAILDYSVAQLDEEFMDPVEPPLGEELPPGVMPFRTRLDLPPPPIFSQRFLPPSYGYKNAPQSVLEMTVDPYTGESRQRYVNKSRLIATGPQRVGHGHAKGQVPTEPVKAVKDRLGKVSQPLLEKLKKLFEERPVWLRVALLAQLTPEEERNVINEKTYLAAVCYTFGAGPYWKCYARLGYDPVYEPSAYIYQRIYFYITVQRAKVTMLRAQSVESADEEEEEETKDGGWWLAEQERRVAAGERGPVDRTKAHMFDGHEINRSKPDFQLCDISDPLLRKYIDNPNLRNDTCDSKDGWYKPFALAAIRNICKIKYAYVREHGHAAPNELCYEEIEKFERAMRGAKEGSRAEDDEEGADAGEDEEMEE